MSMNSAGMSETWMKSVDTLASTQSTVSANEVVSKAVKTTAVMQGISSVLIIAGLIAGIVYMIKSQKPNKQKILIGVVIIVVPFIIRWILNMISFKMLLNGQIKFFNIIEKIMKEKAYIKKILFKKKDNLQQIEVPKTEKLSQIILKKV